MNSRGLFSFILPPPWSDQFHRAIYGEYSVTKKCPIHIFILDFLNGYYIINKGRGFFSPSVTPIQKVKPVQGKGCLDNVTIQTTPLNRDISLFYIYNKQFYNDE